MLRGLIECLPAQWRAVDQPIAALEEQILALARRDDTSRRLMAIPCVEPMLATALVAAVGSSTARFHNGRSLAAWLGLIPCQHSSGGKARLLGVARHGNRYLRRLLVHAATSPRSLWPPSSPTWVQRIRRQHETQPHRAKTFKLSKDPTFTSKLRNEVGLHVHPSAQSRVRHPHPHTYSRRSSPTRPPIFALENRSTNLSRSENNMSILKPATNATANGVIASLVISSAWLNQPIERPATPPRHKRRKDSRPCSIGLIVPIGPEIMSLIRYTSAPRKPYISGNKNAPTTIPICSTLVRIAAILGAASRNNFRLPATVFGSTAVRLMSVSVLLISTDPPKVTLTRSINHCYAIQHSSQTSIALRDGNQFIREVA